MKSLHEWFLVAALLAMLAAPAAAAEPAGELSTPGASWTEMVSMLPGDQQSGAWAEYAIIRDGVVQYAETMRLVVLVDDPKREPWIEVWLGKTGGNALRARSTGADGGVEAYVKMGPLIYSLRDKRTAERAVCEGGTCQAGPKKHDVGAKWTTTKTVAGTFKCLYRSSDTARGKVETWTTTDVPLLGLVRFKLGGKNGYELVAYGRDPTSAFPKEFKAAPLPLQNMEPILALLPAMPGKSAPKSGDPGCDPATASCPSSAGGRAAPNPSPSKAP